MRSSAEALRRRLSGVTVVAGQETGNGRCWAGPDRLRALRMASASPCEPVNVRGTNARTLGPNLRVAHKPLGARTTLPRSPFPTNYQDYSIG